MLISCIRTIFRKWGFVKTVMDLIEGPEYYVSYLHDRFHLEKVLIGTELSEKLFQEIGEKTNLSLFYTGKRQQCECDFVILRF